MTTKYYFDTCIWRDHYEDRLGKTGRALGKYATDLFNKIITNKDKILFSTFIYSELKKSYNHDEIDSMLNLLFQIDLLERVEISNSQFSESLKISLERNVPRGDALFVILARDNNAILVTQDRHFDKLKDIVEIRRPEDI